MGTKVVPSQPHCLHRRFCCKSLALTTSPEGNSRPNNASRSRPRKLSPIAVRANQHDRDHSRLCHQSPGASLVMGQVKILKRGAKLSSNSSCPAVVASSENLEAAAKREECLEMVRESTGRFGKNRVDPKDEIFSGCVLDSSPSPRSVPVPRFLGKKLRPPVI